MKERKRQGEKREKQEQIGRINEQVDRTAPQLCVIYDIWKEEKLPRLAPPPSSMVLPKEAPFKEVKESAAQIENRRARALRTCRGSPSGTWAPVSPPELGGEEQTKKSRRRASTALPLERTDRRHVRSDVQRKDSLTGSYTQDWLQIVYAGEGTAFPRVLYLTASSFLPGVAAALWLCTSDKHFTNWGYTEAK